MRQFSVCRMGRGPGHRSDRLVVVLQNDLLDELRTRIVAPLLGLTQSAPIEHLSPQVALEGRPYRIGFHKMAAVDARDLEFVGRIDVHDALMRAVDLIFAGV